AEPHYCQGGRTHRPVDRLCHRAPVVAPRCDLGHRHHRLHHPHVPPKGPHLDPASRPGSYVCPGTHHPWRPWHCCRGLAFKHSPRRQAGPSLRELRAPTPPPGCRGQPFILAIKRRRGHRGYPRLDYYNFPV
ncbi:hypothetical protein EV182_005210, partial [Spiromyces aspiralis]